MWYANEAGADVVYRVSGGDPPKARTWSLDDVSEAPERIPIIKNPYSSRHSHKLQSKTTSPDNTPIFDNNGQVC